MTRNGFTLVEMLVALLIFGGLAAGSVALLSVSVRTQEVAAAKLGVAGEIRGASALIAGDLANAAPRLRRGEAGEPRPAFASTTGGGVVVSFVRRGWENADGERRSSLQRVDYQLAGGELVRLAYPHVDGTQPTRRATLLSGVRSAAVRVRAANGEWREHWDPRNPAELPRALELVLETERHGALRQVLLVGATG